MGKVNQESIEFLKKIGLLIPFDENLEIYHGRVHEENGGNLKNTKI